MKKITKILPLVVFSSLILVACNKTNNANQDAIVNNDNGITEYTVTVDLNGGTYEGQTTLTRKVRRGTYYSFFKSELPTKDDITYPGHELKFYSFEGQTEEIGETERFYEDKTIVAQYKVTGTQHTVTWKNEDGTTLGDPELYCEGETPVYKGEDPVHTPVPGKSYTWTGWTPEIAEVTADATYTAKFSEQTTACVVTFDPKGGTVDTPSLLVAPGATIEDAPVATKDYYTQTDKWFYKNGTEEVEFKFGTAASGATTVSADMNLYCKWESPKTFTITINPANETGTTTVTGTYGQSLDKPTTPTYNDHTFDGWYKKVGDVEETQPYEFSRLVDGAFTLTAHWKANVTYHYNNGTTETNIVPLKVGEIITKPTWIPAYEGHTFTGWYQQAEGGDPYDFGSEMTANPVDIYAHWTETPAPTTYYVVSFNSQGGSFVPGIQVEAGKAPTEAQKPADPTLIGKAFGGWYKDSDCSEGQEFTFGDGGTVVSGDMTVYAKWNDEAANFSYSNSSIFTPNTLEVKDDSNTQTLTKGAGATRFAFERSSLHFHYALGSGEPDLTNDRITITINSVTVEASNYDITTTATGEYDITPHSDVVIPVDAFIVIALHDALEAESHVITFDTRGGQPTPGSKIVADGGTCPSIESVFWDDHQHLGWFYLDNGVETEFKTSEITITKDINVYSKWEASTHVNATLHCTDFDPAGKILLRNSPDDVYIGDGQTDYFTYYTTSTEKTFHYSGTEGVKLKAENITITTNSGSTITPSYVWDDVFYIDISDLNNVTAITITLSPAP